MHSYDLQAEAPFSLTFNINTLDTSKLISAPRSISQVNDPAAFFSLRNTPVSVLWHGGYSARQSVRDIEEKCPCLHGVQNSDRAIVRAEQLGAM
jgi:hypothetical protein